MAWKERGRADLERDGVLELHALLPGAVAVGEAVQRRLPRGLRRRAHHLA